MWWKYFIIISCLISLTLADCDRNCLYRRRKPYHHHHYDHFYHHLFYGSTYLAFLFVKVKIVFVVGMIFTFMFFSGKLFAIIRYLDSRKREDSHSHVVPEKIYIQAPSHGHDYSFSHPTSYSSDSSGPPSPPSSRIYSSLGPRLRSDTFMKDSYHPQNGPEIYYNSPPTFYQGRNYDYSNIIYDKYKQFTKIINKLNLTELTFDKMKVTSEECKRKFVCRMDLDARYSSILTLILDVLSDDSYRKYRTTIPVTSHEDCEKLYPNCKLKTDTT